MMLPSQVTMIPVFLLWRQFGLIDTFAPLVAPAFFGGGAFTIFLLRQFFMTIPRELDEAAMLDGANPLTIWWRVLLPLSRPALITVILFSFIGHWDDFMGPLIYLNSMEKYTVSIGLRMFQDQFGTQLELLMAAALIHILPTILLFFVAQRYFIKGIALTGLKG
jgi:multiple sugar transport system permease protein